MSDIHAEEVRRFNRFYTQEIGVLNERLLRSPFSLSEVRVLYEIAHNVRPSASAVGKQLNLDPGYLSRIIKRFLKDGLLKRSDSERDGREYVLSLTSKGHREFSVLDQRAHEEIEAKLQRLSPQQQDELVRALQTAQTLLGAPVPGSVPYVIRLHQPGDLGWVVQRHGTLYYQEYGWDHRFEGLVAGIVAGFVKNFDAKRERCWIAERNGERIGCIFLVRKTDTIAKLRLLLVEPGARGLGLGRRLVDECLRFAGQAGYRKVVLWTNSILEAARHIYEQTGFQLTGEQRHRDFGPVLVGQTWEKKL
jgi:DNA-binding MarR family transcriptional regulator/GNAT superfamily N-acetyltransferase